MNTRSLNLAVQIAPGEVGQRSIARLLDRLRRLPGLGEAGINNAHDTLRLQFDPALVTTTRLEYELRESGISLAVPIIRHHLLLDGLQSYESALEIETTLNALPGVLWAGVNFVVAQAHLETQAGALDPSYLTKLLAGYGVRAQISEISLSAPSEPRSFPSSAFSLRTILPLCIAVALGSAGLLIEQATLPSPAFPVARLLLGLALLIGGWPALLGTFRAFMERTLDRSILLVLALGGLVWLNQWNEAVAAVLAFRGGEMAQTALLEGFRTRFLQWRARTSAAPEADPEKVTTTLFLHSLDEALTRPMPVLRRLFPPARLFALLTGLLAVGTIAVPSLLQGGFPAPTGTAWLHRGLILLPLASPGTFYLFASLSISAALVSAAKEGILLRGGATLETLAHVRAAVYAKTGILTQGQFVVEDVVPFHGWTCADVLRVAGALQPDPQHPVAQALRQAASQFRHVVPLLVDNLEGIPGQETSAIVDNTRFLLGNHRWLAQNQVPMMRQAEEAMVEAESQGKTALLLGVPGGLLGIMVLHDTPRPAAAGLKAVLSQLGLSPQIALSEDNSHAVAVAAEAAGLDGSEGGLNNGEQAERLNALRKSTGRVVAIGSGRYDAPLLDSADCGFAVCRPEQPDALLIPDIAARTEDPDALPFSIRLARKTEVILFRGVGITLTGKVLLIALVFCFSLPLWSLLLADSLLAIALSYGVLRSLSLPERDVPEPLRPVMVTSSSRDSSSPAEPLLELVFSCDPTADEEPDPARQYPQWQPFTVPFYGEPLRFGRNVVPGAVPIQVEDEGVSRLHGEVRLEGKFPVVVDLRSTNGIRRNGASPGTLLPSEIPVPLKFGDTFLMGRNTRLEIRLPMQNEERT